jgi:hypothetical protein
MRPTLSKQERPVNGSISRFPSKYGRDVLWSFSVSLYVLQAICHSRRLRLLVSFSLCIFHIIYGESDTPRKESVIGMDDFHTLVFGRASSLSTSGKDLAD